MIANEGEIRALLGLHETITDEERVVLMIQHPAAEKAVRDFIHYDPEQKLKTEHYPRWSHIGGVAYPNEGLWDANASHSHAVFSRTSLADAATSLQLERLPIRRITSVKVDDNAHFGKGDNAWPSGSEWTEGRDFFPEYDETDVCESGLLNANGTWPITPGSVEIVYLAGYSPAELAGRATEDKEENGIVTTAGVSAIGLKQAVILTVMKGFKTWAANKKKSGLLGFAAGVLTSEKAQDYSYTIDPGTAAALAGLVSHLPGEAQELAEPHINWGWQRL